MGVISDAIDSLQEWCENLFKDGIKSQFDSISDLMTETFHKTTEDGGLISTFLTGHPASFSGSASGGTTIWSTIETLCNNVVVPIGGFILVIILLNDLIQTVIRGNNFKDFDDSIFIKWIIKALCGVILVSNVFYVKIEYIPPVNADTSTTKTILGLKWGHLTDNNLERTCS